jgi:hypothetical protein
MLMKILSGNIGLIIVVVFCSLNINAQPVKSFSEDAAKFPAEVQLLFSNISSPTTGMKIRDLLNPFIELWNANVYHDEEKLVIMSNANALLTRRIPNYPDMYNYLSIIHHLKKKGNREAVSIWSGDLANRLPVANQRQIQSYLEQYELIVTRNILFQSSTFTWYISDSSFRIEYDTAIRVIYHKADLTCATKKDTTEISNTIGIFYPNTLDWAGQKGRVSWERVGFDPDSVYADLSNYRINMKFSEYHADTVRMINKRYFKEPLYGELTEKVLASPPGPSSTYPQFASYLKNYEIRNLFKNIDYLGGFSVEGARVIGSGEINENASLFITQSGQIRAHIRSNAFWIQGDQITANPASLSIITNGDSIYHPGLQLKYFNNKRQLVMFRSEGGISQSPFFNGFHEIDMDCGAMYWNLDSNTVDFESVPGVNRVSVNELISNNFFSKFEFYKIQGIDEKHPLYIIRDYSRSFGTNEITPGSLAQFMNKSPDQVKAMMLKLSIQGFLYYDLINDKAIIQDRLNQYIESNVGAKDYDVISINSETNNISNVTLNLENYDLLVRGVNEVFLSDSQQVYIYPENDEITIKKGLDFVFSGIVKAGLFDFYAHNCSFEYDSFKLNLPLIDSLSFQVKSFNKDDKGNQPLKRVESVIENLSGKLMIDHPTNKSGLQSFPEFPIFDSEQESFVYYDHDPLYERDSFAYHIYPFVLDSLDNFSTDNLNFDGYLVSDGIFPNIKQPLKVQADYSLGFINQVPDNGYPAYSGKGIFYDEVNLSNRGLRGNGKLKFLTSMTLSDNFHFYPDSMITVLAKKFTIDPQIAKVEYPRVGVDTVYQVWYPDLDTMHLQTIKLPFKMYEEKALLYGDLYYSSKGLYGRGEVGFESVELASERYVFRNHTLDADTLDFKLYATGTEDLAVSAKKYRTHVDFDTRIVEFKTNEKGSTVSFPYNNFVCFMDNIDWYMDQHVMKLYNDLGEKYANIDRMSRKELLKLDLSGSDFKATNPQADSLSFFSVTAQYDLLKYIIDAENVKLIRVADAAIFPDSGYVTISKGGQIQTLKNAGIIADTANLYHTIENAEANIFSRKKYEAKGIYQYHDSSNVVQQFPLEIIAVDSTGRTFARGEIAEDPDFFLDPHFSFKGKVNLTSSKKELYFEGGFQTRDECFKAGTKYWVYFKSWIDPDRVRIPVNQPLVDLDGNSLHLGIQISDYEEEIYPTWFTPKVLSWDTTLVNASGEIYFDGPANGYRISPAEKEPPVLGESGFFYNTRNCTMEASGSLGLGLFYNYVDLKSYGDIRYMVVPDSTTLNLTLAFDFLFYEASLNAMADSLSLSDLKGLDVTRKSYQDYLDYSMGEAEAKDLKDDISIYGNIRRLPEELVHTIVLTDVKLYWNPFTNSYISRGPIGVMSLGKNAVNRYLNGNLELIRRRGGDAITLYLEVNPMQYYFFDYRNGIMQTISSDMVYNNRIETLKQEKRVMNKPGLEETYEFLLSSRRKLIDFLRRMEPFMN